VTDGKNQRINPEVKARIVETAKNIGKMTKFKLGSSAIKARNF